MRVLVLGSGAREHALVHHLTASPLVNHIACAGGNAGTPHRLPAPASHEEVVALARTHRFDLVIPAAEAPLADGLIDHLENAGIAAFGPTAAAAQLEASKGFARICAREAGVPVPSFTVCASYKEAHDHLMSLAPHDPVVVKADGLAAGKGVVVADTRADALDALQALHQGGHTAFVLEETMHGPEVSLFALCDGTTAMPLATARDYKRVGENDQGPNTGGMGALAPAPMLANEDALFATFFPPVLAAMRERGAPFKGILYAGVMETSTGPKLLEFNVRFGDPECQAIIPLLANDLMPALVAARQGTLHTLPSHHQPRLHDACSVAVVLAALGYPNTYATDTPLTGWENPDPHTHIFHAATEKTQDGKLINTGGRTLTVVATAPTLDEAHSRVYNSVEHINWPQGFYRRDIAARYLTATKEGNP